MPLKLICPHCSARLAANNDKLPKQVICPKCRQNFRPLSTDGGAAPTGTPQAHPEPGLKNAPPQPARASPNVASTSNSGGASNPVPLPKPLKPNSTSAAAPPTWKSGDSM